MSDCYIGEVRMIGFGYAPAGWLMCDGSTLPISQNETLFTLIGTTYGGDGSSTFMLPDLRGRVPVHQGSLAGGSLYTLGQTGGQTSVTLTTTTLPSHSHPLNCQNNGGSAQTAAGNFFAAPGETVFELNPSTYVAMGSIVSAAGQSQPHDNMQPYQAINYMIATQGVYPTPS